MYNKYITIINTSLPEKGMAVQIISKYVGYGHIVKFR